MACANFKINRGKWNGRNKFMTVKKQKKKIKIS